MRSVNWRMIMNFQRSKELLERETLDDTEFVEIMDKIRAQRLDRQGETGV